MSMDVEVMEDCASNYGNYEVAGSNGKTWRVSLNGAEGTVYCDCPSFKFSKEQACKHTDMVCREACLYNPQYGSAKAEPKIRPVSYNYDRFTKNKCACGGPMVAVRRAV